jgi:hypothetical protein
MKETFSFTYCISTAHLVFVHTQANTKKIKRAIFIVKNTLINNKNE